MQYQIKGQVTPVVEVTLNSGETMYTQSGGMAWQTDGIEMSTNTNGGLMKGLGRMLAGESLFMANYTAKKDGAKIAFNATMPGSVIAIDCSKGSYIAQKRAFLAAEKSVDVKIAFTKKAGAGFFGGEGFILQEIKGSGTAFLEIDGDAIEYDLAPGEVLKVDTGNVAAFESTVSYDIETISGLKNIFLGGEGLFLTKLTGPGKVYLQTMSVSELAGLISTFIPSKN